MLLGKFLNSQRYLEYINNFEALTKTECILFVKELVLIMLLSIYYIIIKLAD